MIYITLFYEFFKIGLFTFGGGLATIPFLQDLSQKTGWFTLSQLTDFIAISESTPGPVAVNMATYTGYEVAGILGGFVATLGLIFPAFILISLMAKF
ncbi:MAG: chromate transporter, partial [Oscillospiraceae bacterium]